MCSANIACDVYHEWDWHLKNQGYPGTPDFGFQLKIDRLISPQSSICLSIEFRISNFERIDRARESTAKFRLALALEFQLRKFCGAESECATGPHKRPVDH